MAITSGSGTDICIRVGRRIAELRAARGWTQQVLADLAGIERSHLARLELGEREAGLRMLEKIADAMGADVTELLKKSGS
jgi:transcriptional regulator with XRE-family HTH domain